MTDAEAALMVRVVSAAADALAVPVTHAALCDAVVDALRSGTGIGRVVIPGDRIAVADRGGPEVVDVDVGLRGRFAGRVHLAVNCLARDEAEDTAGAVVRALAAVSQRAYAAFVVTAGPSATPGDRGDALTDRPRPTVTLAAGADHGLTGLRVPARVRTVLVANSPLAAAEGWTVRAYRVEGEGGEVEL